VSSGAAQGPDSPPSRTRRTLLSSSCSGQTARSSPAWPGCGRARLDALPACRPAAQTGSTPAPRECRPPAQAGERAQQAEQRAALCQPERGKARDLPASTLSKRSSHAGPPRCKPHPPSRSRARGPGRCRPAARPPQTRGSESTGTAQAAFRGFPQGLPHAARLAQLALLPARQGSAWLCQEQRKPLPTADCCQTPAACQLAYSPRCSPRRRAPGSKHVLLKRENIALRGTSLSPLMWDQVPQERHRDPSGKAEVWRNCFESGVCLPFHTPCGPPRPPHPHTLAARLLGRPPRGGSRASAASPLPSIFCTQMGSGAGHSRS